MHEQSRTQQLPSEQRWRNLTEALPQLVWSAMPDGSAAERILRAMQSGDLADFAPLL